MPLYEYKCQACGDVFEIIQKFSDEPLTVHQNCGGKVERLISTSALQFKGSGWYVTDYGKGNSKEPKPKPDSNGSNKGEKPNGKSASSDSASKSDSPAGKSDSSSSSTASTPSSSKSDSK